MNLINFDYSLLQMMSMNFKYSKFKIDWKGWVHRMKSVVTDSTISMKLLTMIMFVDFHLVSKRVGEKQKKKSSEIKWNIVEHRLTLSPFFSHDDMRVDQATIENDERVANLDN